MMTTDADHSDGKSIPYLFLHAQFELPQPATAAGGNVLQADCSEGDGNDDNATNIIGNGGGGESSERKVVVTKQCFDSSNCIPAVLGLDVGHEPMKVRPA